MSDGGTSGGVLIIMALVVMLALMWIAVLTFGPGAADFARVCGHHEGVASVSAGTLSRKFSVCRDGYVARVRAESR